MTKALSQNSKTKKFYSTRSDNLSAYDTMSIMHYDGTLRGRFGSPIITDKKTGKGIAINRKMSAGDIKKLNEMYPCQPTRNQSLQDEIKLLKEKVDYLNEGNRRLKNLYEKRGGKIENLESELNGYKNTILSSKRLVQGHGLSSYTIFFKYMRQQVLIIKRSEIRQNKKYCNDQAVNKQSNTTNK